MQMLRAFLLAVFVLALVPLAGCYKAPWPGEPTSVRGDEKNPSAYEWQPDGRYGAKLVEVCRDGVKRVFYIDANNDGVFEQVTDLDQVDSNQIRWVFVLLDGVPYKLFDELYQEGHFRLFYPPARYVSTFPSITEISFSSMFGTPGSSCYESILYDRQTNKVHDGLGVYTGRANELWGTAVDYRQRAMFDAYAYLHPRIAGHREFRTMFNKAAGILKEQPRRQHVIIYAMSTDAMAHKGSWPEGRRMLLEIEQYLQRLAYEQKGRIGLAILTDHGNNFVASCKRIDLDNSIRSAGLNPVVGRGFKKPGDVVILRYGLVSMIQGFAQNEPEKMRLVEAMLKTDGVEHVMWRMGPAVRIARRGSRAEISRRLEATDVAPVEYFSYRRVDGDPLELQPILDKLPGRTFGGDDQTYYASQDLLEATAGHLWPDPLWRIWHGLTDAPAVVPDVVGSLALGWYYGNKKFDRFSHLNGTHGGLRDWDSIGFFSTNMFAPPPVMRTTDVLPLLNQRTGWVPKVGDPKTEGLGKFLTTPVNPLSVWPLKEYQRAARMGTRPIWGPPAPIPMTLPATAPAVPPIAPPAPSTRGLVIPEVRPQERFVAPPVQPQPPAAAPATRPGELGSLEAALPPATAPAPPLTPWTAPPVEPPAPGGGAGTTER